MNILKLLLVPFIASATISPTDPPPITSANMPLLGSYQQEYGHPVSYGTVLDPDFATYSYAPDEITEQTIEVPSIEIKEPINDPSAMIYEIFGKDAQTMERVAHCESTALQFHADGTVVKGIQVPDDIGLFQVNLRYHKAEADRLGYDLFTLEGNAQFAKVLFDRNGLRDWSASEKCWNG